MLFFGKGGNFDLVFLHLFLQFVRYCNKATAILPVVNVPHDELLNLRVFWEWVFSVPCLVEIHFRLFCVAALTGVFHKNSTILARFYENMAQKRART